MLIVKCAAAAAAVGMGLHVNKILVLTLFCVNFYLLNVSVD